MSSTPRPRPTGRRTSRRRARPLPSGGRADGGMDGRITSGHDGWGEPLSPPTVMPGLDPLLSGSAELDGVQALGTDGISAHRPDRDTDRGTPAFAVLVPPFVPPDPIRDVSKGALAHRRVADRAPHRLRGCGQAGVADTEGFERIGDGEASRRRDGGEEAAVYSAARRPSTWDWRSARRCISRRKSSIAAWNARRSLPASAI